MKKILQFFLKIRGLHYVIFWGYHFLYFACLGLLSAPLLAGSFLSEFNSMPWNVAIVLYLMILVPLFAVFLGIFTKLKKEPQKLVTFFLAVEIPTLFLILIRLIFIRQITPALWALFLSAFVSMIGLTFFLLKGKFSSKVKQSLLFISQEIAIILQGYLSLLALFFLPIVLVLIVTALVEMEYLEILDLLIRTKGLAFFQFLFFSILFVVTTGIFLISPIAVMVIYWKSFRKTYAQMKKAIGEKSAKYTAWGFFVFYFGLSLSLSLQFESKSYEQTLQEINNASSFKEQQTLAKKLMKQKDSIKDDLLDKYLSKYRYIGDSKIGIVAEGYEEFLGFHTSSADTIQLAFNAMAQPFVYRGRFSTDTENAKNWYKEIFDADIQEGEREAIVKALKATNTQDQLKAGLLDKEEKTVRVVKRDISAKTVADSLIAQVTFEEEYENTSDQIQEVYYEFTLPEDAVITNLWLGPDLEYQGQISPKGAARKTYENQVRRRIDPALLEQVGPRQYKLRVFPISKKMSRLERIQRNIQDEEKNQRVKFEYIAFVEKKGIPLPTITESRNVYDDSTQESYKVNNRSLKASGASAFMEIDSPETVTCSSDVLKTVVGSSNVLFIPHGANSTLENYDCLSQNGVGSVKSAKLAILVDASHSNSSFNVQDYLKSKLPKALLDENEVDLYFFNTKVSQKVKLTKNKINQGFSLEYFGKTDRLEALQSVAGKYDAIFMVTDDSAFDTEREKNVFSQSPIYIVHPSGIPKYQNALSLSVTKSGGGVYVELKDALQNFSILQKIEKTGMQNNYDLLKVNDQGTWMVKANTESSEEPVSINDISNQEFKKLATSSFIKHHLVKTFDTNEIETLDNIHAIAKENSIISPYSSFIALVNDRQQKELEKNEQEKDRFKTSLDVGDERLSDPSGQAMLDIGATPEPEEWVLIIMSMFLLLFFYRQQILQYLKMKLCLS